VQHHGGKTWSVALVNRYQTEAPVTIEWSAPPDGRPFRKYAWAVNAIPSHPFGDLQSPESTLPLKNGRLADTLAPLSLTVYTTAHDDDPPAAVKDVKVAKTEAGANRVTWQANAEPDFCYYRVYRGEKADFAPSVATQIGSTVATEFEDAKPGAGEAHYKVIAVDQSGNASKP
jgi:hypothetical protein